MKLIISNAGEVLTKWAKYLDLMLDVGSRRIAILICHGAKVEGINPMAELSDLDLAQVAAYHDVIKDAVEEARHWTFAASSRPSRYIESSMGLLGLDWKKIRTPASLDIVNLGPDAADFIAAKKLVADGLYASPNEAHSNLKKHGIRYLGEPPDQARIRVRAGIVTMLSEVCDTGEVLVLSVNSPKGNNAVGVEGVLGELETLVVAYDPETDQFELLDRVTPIFAPAPEEQP